MSELKEKLKIALDKCLELDGNNPDGTYLHWLTRVKAGYAVNTVTIDDFEEIDEELTTDILKDIMPIIEQENDKLKQENKTLKQINKELENEVAKFKAFLSIHDKIGSDKKQLEQENKALKNELAEFKVLLVKFANNDRLNEFYDAESNKLDYIQNRIKALETSE